MAEIDWDSELGTWIFRFPRLLKLWEKSTSCLGLGIFYYRMDVYFHTTRWLFPTDRLRDSCCRKIFNFCYKKMGILFTTKWWGSYHRKTTWRSHGNMLWTFLWPVSSIRNERCWIQTVFWLITKWYSVGALVWRTWELQNGELNHHLKSSKFFLFILTGWVKTVWRKLMNQHQCPVLFFTTFSKRNKDMFQSKQNPKKKSCHSGPTSTIWLGSTAQTTQDARGSPPGNPFGMLPLPGNSQHQDCYIFN